MAKLLPSVLFVALMMIGCANQETGGKTDQNSSDKVEQKSVLEDLKKAFPYSGEEDSSVLAMAVYLLMGGVLVDLGIEWPIGEPIPQAANPPLVGIKHRPDSTGGITVKLEARNVHPHTTDTFTLTLNTAQSSSPFGPVHTLLFVFIISLSFMSRGISPLTN